MKKLLISFIRLYQKIPFASHSLCRFRPTCSEYAIEAIDTYGAIVGSYMSLKRIFRCRPFGKSGYDPVPLKEKSK